MRAILIQRHGVDMGSSMRKWNRGQGRVGFIRVDDPSYCYQQAKKRKDLLTQEARVIKSKSPYWNYLFAKDIKNANIQAHIKRIGSVFDLNIIEELNHISQDRVKQKKLKKGLD